MKREKSDNRSIAPVIAELERAFRVFARSLPFGVELAQPVITVMPAGRKQMLGWFAKKAWASGGADGAKEAIPEINLCAEHLRRDADSICETLLHEMCHLANAISGVKDCNSNQYHNAKFKAMCDKIGLVCVKSDTAKSKGYAWTSLSDDLRKLIAEVGIDPAVFRYRLSEGFAGTKAATKMKKWICACTTVRCAVDLTAECLECGEQFKLADSEGGEDGGEGDV